MHRTFGIETRQDALDVLGEHFNKPESTTRYLVALARSEVAVRSNALNQKE